MRSHSETHTTPSGARVEVSTITVDGRDFTALGAVVDMANGVICAYVTAGPVDPLARGPRATSYTLTTWEGKEIAKLTLRGSWQQYGFGGVRNTIWAWSATVDGVVYSGRNSGPSMFVRMRAGKTVKP